MQCILGAWDFSPYCEDVSKMTTICNDIYGGSSMICKKTCQKQRPLQCGVRKPLPPSNGAPKGEIGEDGNKAKEILQRFRRVVGGREAINGEWPWLVSLRLNGVLKCNGAVLSKDWVLTAASCFDADYSSANPNDWRVFAGDYKFSQSENKEQMRRVKTILKHDKYFPFWKEGHVDIPDDFDVALLKLSTPLSLNDHISPICIPDAPEDFDNAECTVTGWGRSQSSHIVNDIPRTAKVQLVSRAICNAEQAYNGSIHSRAICGRYRDNANGVTSDACNQDSGGPLACQKKGGRWAAVGLVSWGYSCGQGGPLSVYGVFTKMQHAKIKEWIVLTILSYNDVINNIESIPQIYRRSKLRMLEMKKKKSME